jgi:hypothetical protein
LIFKELQHDIKTLFTCLTVNKTWCETIIPILWKNPWKSSLKEKNSLCNVIISHLSDESRKNLKSQGVDFLTNHYQRPLFNYVNFCRQLNLNNLNKIISTNDHIVTFSTIKKEIIEKEIINLFINENTRITHLYIPHKFNHQIHLISGVKYCFSELEFLSCSTNIHDNVLIGLLELIKSIKELELFIGKDNYNCGIVKLIENSKKLLNIYFITNSVNEPFRKALENSLIGHANTIQYFKINRKPITNILSSLVNLKILELYGSVLDLPWSCLEKLSLPYLQILKTRYVPIKSLASLIENTNGYLTEIKIDDTVQYEIDNKRIIQSIYQNCPNLQYLKVLIRDKNIPELEKLLIKCQYLIGLYIATDNSIVWKVDYYGSDVSFDWDYLFKILAVSSPISLFKFKLQFFEAFKFESLKLFLDNWKDRNSMYLQTFLRDITGIEKMKCFDLTEYKVQGIIKYYSHTLGANNNFEEFE